MAGITDEERKVFMSQMLPEPTADTKGGEDGEFYVEKVIKMCVNKVGMEDTWEPFENLSGEEACEYSFISVIIPYNLFKSSYQISSQ